MFYGVEKREASLINAGLHGLLLQSQIGLEKESLRVSPEGQIARTPHPEALGSALTHPYITTDYSEALAEFITPPCGSAHEALTFLQDTQKFAYDNLKNEILWATSMPCILTGGENIPLAEYGFSNIGMMKTVYRRGLGHRYGRMMQIIAGVHFNYSLPEAFWPVYQEFNQAPGSLRDFTDDAYFGLVRNLQRYGWLIPYLFGASPAVCKSFLSSQNTNLDEFDAHTCFKPFATSLRMGDIGYTNSKEAGAGIKADYDHLAGYIASLTHAIRTPCPQWQHIGVKKNSRYEQLNANILQIENEYYSTVRPKQVPEGNEKPTVALSQRGVRYVELRSLDVDPFDPQGISKNQVYFLQAFMLFCLLQESPQIDSMERREIDDNLLQTAHHGRDPGLKLQCNGSAVLLKDWALRLCESMEGVCSLLDGSESQKPYSQALDTCRNVVRDPDQTPSARMLEEMRQKSETFFHFARRMSQGHHEYFQGLELSAEKKAFFQQEALASQERQSIIESGDECSFDAFLNDYFNNPRKSS